MIIHRVWSQNVLKYATLELNDLPAPGLIGLSGANESGKSTIGEIICFALFGRTYAYAEDEIVNLIRWGEPSCAVTIDFSIHDQRYTVSRFLDDKGEQGARLNAQQETLLARGIEPVQNALETLLGFGFEEFVESFYLAQREITTPHPHSMAVKKMAGIAALEQVADAARAEIRQERAAIGDSERAILDLEQRVAELDVEPSLLPQLEHEREALQQQQKQLAQQMADVQAKTQHYQSLENNISATIEEFCHVKVDASYQSWRRHAERFNSSLEESAQHLAQEPTLTHLTGQLKDVAQGVTERLSAFHNLRDSANDYRQHLLSQLDENTLLHAPDQQANDTLPGIQAHLQARLNAVQKRYARTRLGVYTCLPLALLGWVIWALQTQMPTSGFAQTVSNWLPGPLWPLVVPLLPSILLLGFGLRSLVLRSRVAQLTQAVDDMQQQIVQAHRQADALDTLDDAPLPQAVQMLMELKGEAVADAAIRFQQGIGADLIEAGQLDAYKVQLHSLKDHCVSDIKAQCNALAGRLKTLQHDTTTCQETLDPLCERIGQEQGRHQSLSTLQAQRSNQQEQIAACKRRIQTRELACDLAARGAQHMATTFNRDIRDLVSRTLPLLTQGRYEHLKIDANLDVQVFSNQKRDFMKFEEVSTGTQRQIMLAVRLALSQQFINTTLSRPQFIFLDEPFAFFDESRTRSALQSLPKLSDELTQFWIIAQAFPEGFGFDLEIHCEQGRDVLSLPAS